MRRYGGSGNEGLLKDFDNFTVRYRLPFPERDFNPLSKPIQYQLRIQEFDRNFIALAKLQASPRGENKSAIKSFITNHNRAAISTAFYWPRSTALFRRKKTNPNQRFWTHREGKKHQGNRIKLC